MLDWSHGDRHPLVGSSRKYLPARFSTGGTLESPYSYVQLVFEGVSTGPRSSLRWHPCGNLPRPRDGTGSFSTRSRAGNSSTARRVRDGPPALQPIRAGTLSTGFRPILKDQSARRSPRHWPCGHRPVLPVGTRDRYQARPSRVSTRFPRVPSQQVGGITIPMLLRLELRRTCRRPPLSVPPRPSTRAPAPLRRLLPREVQVRRLPVPRRPLRPAPLWRRLHPGRGFLPRNSVPASWLRPARHRVVGSLVTRSTVSLRCFFTSRWG